MEASLAPLPSNYWHLKNSGFSSSIGETALQRLAGNMHVRTFPRGDMFLPSLNGDAALCVLLEGSVGVCRVDPLSGKEVILYIVKPGEFFGNLGTPGSEQRASMVRALEKSRVGTIDTAGYQRLMRDERFQRAVQQSMQMRLAQLEGRMEELLFNSVKSRLGRLLLRLSNDFPGQCPERHGTMIDVSLRQSDIACLIAASREITSLTLNELRRAGCIDFHERRICIHDRDALRETSHPVEP